MINAKTPGTVTRIAPAHMDFNYDVAFGSYSPEAYERLLLDAILGDSRCLSAMMRWKVRGGSLIRLKRGGRGDTGGFVLCRGHVGSGGGDGAVGTRGPALVGDGGSFGGGRFGY